HPPTVEGRSPARPEHLDRLVFTCADRLPEQAIVGDAETVHLYPRAIDYAAVAREAHLRRNGSDVRRPLPRGEHLGDGPGLDYDGVVGECPPLAPRAPDAGRGASREAAILWQLDHRGFGDRLSCPLDGLVVRAVVDEHDLAGRVKAGERVPQ